MFSPGSYSGNNVMVGYSPLAARKSAASLSKRMDWRKARRLRRMRETQAAREAQRERCERLGRLLDFPRGCN